MDRIATGWGRDFAVVLLAGSVLAFLGPFGTYQDLAPFERGAYWVGLTVLMWLQTVVAFGAVRRSRLARLPEVAQAALAALAGAVPTTFQVAWAEGLLRVGGVLTPRSLLETYGYVAVIALCLFVPLRLTRRRAAPAHLAPPEAVETPPGELGRAVALAAEDHYLRVYTDAGERLIHHRFSQAVQALGPAGLQVHRSWWVAKGAVERAERTGDRYVLVLKTGLRVPVSRSFSLAAREAGLLPLRD